MTGLIHIARRGHILCHHIESGLVFTIPHVDADGMQEQQLCPDCLRRWRNEHPKPAAINREQKRKIIQKIQTNKKNCYDITI